MDTLPDELILEIFNHILLITDKRQFLRICNNYNLLTKRLFLEYENNYVIKYFNKIKGYNLEKFTLELCHDGYFDLIPEHYIISGNEVLIKSLSYFGNLKLLKLCKIKGFGMSDICAYSSLGGKLSVLQWACNNGHRWDWLTITNAVDKWSFIGVTVESFVYL